MCIIEKREFNRGSLKFETLKNDDCFLLIKIGGNFKVVYSNFKGNHGNLRSVMLKKR